MMMSEIDLFVPGRLCLFGEHSDWMVEYPKTRASSLGYAIITCTKEGIYAKCYKSNTRLVEYMNPAFSERCHVQDLRSAAITRRFPSYIYGVAHIVYERFGIQGGLVIDNYKTDLPIKKGLSSSAAICILTIRAFNILYGLGLKIEDEIELAYAGERMTMSQCGKLDMTLAYKSSLLVSFGENGICSIVERLASQNGPIHLLLVDLGGEKDTIKILQSLHECFNNPCDHSAQVAKVRRYLGPRNREIVFDAVNCIQEGDAESLGKLMNVAQNAFDECMIPVCPGQLKSPLLHKCLALPQIQDFIWGGKGVGSQGDGMCQFVCKSRQDLEKMILLMPNLGFPRIYPLTLF